MDVRDMLSPPASPPVGNRSQKRIDQAPASVNCAKWPQAFMFRPTEIRHRSFDLDFQVRDGESGEVERRFRAIAS